MCGRRQRSFAAFLKSLPDARGRARLVATFDPEVTEPEWALGYSWDIVLRGRQATPREA